METVTLQAAPIFGTVTPPPSKSAAHRALICTALAGRGRVRGIIDSHDMQATLHAIEALGLRAEHSHNMVTIIEKLPPVKGRRIVDCGESGSTLRFFIPIFAALGISCEFVGQGRLPERPLDVYAKCLPEHGITLSAKSGLPLQMDGKLQPGTFVLAGDVSSQFITGLLFALPLLDGDSEIVLTTALESAPYVDMTLDALAQAGIEILPTETGWLIPGRQRYLPRDYIVEGDWSQAAFLLAMGALGGEISLRSMNMLTSQGDVEVVDILKRMGADIFIDRGMIHCRKAPLHGTCFEATQIPDLVPILAVVAAFAEGETLITGAGRARIKESDRLSSTADCLRTLGASIEELPEGLRIYGKPTLPGGVTVNGHNDHRIVMSMAVSALRCEQPITVTDASSIDKSWPSFFNDYQYCGGKAYGL